MPPPTQAPVSSTHHTHTHTKSTHIASLQQKAATRTTKACRQYRYTSMIEDGRSVPQAHPVRDVMCPAQWACLRTARATPCFMHVTEQRTGHTLTQALYFTCNAALAAESSGVALEYLAAVAWYSSIQASSRDRRSWVKPCVQGHVKHTCSHKTSRAHTHLDDRPVYKDRCYTAQELLID